MREDAVRNASPRRNAQLVRTLTLIRLLELKPRTLNDLATVLGCHRRTVQRDLAAIEQAGYFLTSHAPQIERKWTEKDEPTRWWITQGTLADADASRATHVEHDDQDVVSRIHGQ